MRCRRLALDLGHPLGIAGKAQAAIHLPAGGEAGFLLQLVVELDRVFEELGDIGGSAELTDQTRGMPGRTAGEFAALDEDDVFPAEPGQMIGGGAADDAAADD